MRFLSWAKDGGPESTVYGFFLIEIKSLFSVVLLNFRGQSREAFHTHAFDAISWVLKGWLLEELHELPWHSLSTKMVYSYLPSRTPIHTPRERFHKVNADNDTWVLSFRGPWRKSWMEFVPQDEKYRALTHGRLEIR
jgi:hypothetical protein